MSTSLVEWKYFYIYFCYRHHYPLLSKLAYCYFKRFKWSMETDKFYANGLFLQLMDGGSSTKLWYIPYIVTSSDTKVAWRSLFMKQHPSWEVWCPFYLHLHRQFHIQKGDPWTRLAIFGPFGSMPWLEGCLLSRVYAFSFPKTRWPDQIH